MKNILAILVFLFALHVLATVVYCSEHEKKPCTREEAMQAESDIDNLKDWNSLYKSFQRFSHCDDASIGEGYSDDVGKLLANSWEEFPSFAKLAHADQAFQRFVIKHIDETVPIDTLRKISNNAKSHCPRREGRLCKLIQSRVP